MSVIKTLGIDGLLESYGVRYFLEIGTGSGADVEYAATLGFEHAYSIETVHMFAVAVYGRNARNKKMTVAFGRVNDCVKGILDLIPTAAPVLYWLNSQALDIRFGMAEADILRESAERQDACRRATRTAGEHLALIAGLRPVAGDVFLLGGYAGDDAAAFAPAVDLLGASHGLDIARGVLPALRALPKRH